VVRCAGIRDSKEKEMMWHRVDRELPAIGQFAVWWSEFGLIEPVIAFIAEGEDTRWCYRYSFWFPIATPPKMPDVLADLVFLTEA